MKKMFNIFLTVLILMISFIPYMPIYAEDCPYEVAVAYADNDVRLKCYATYSEAYTAMNNYESTESAVAIIKQGTKIINAKYALVNMARGDVTTRLYDKAEYITYENNTGSDYYDTYVHGQWGVDAAFMGYDSQHKAVKLMISGYTGYARSNQVEIVPLSKFITPKLLITATEVINVRSAPDNSVNNIIGGVKHGTEHEYYPSETIKNGKGGYTWYKIKHGTEGGYIASAGETWTKELENKLNINTYYKVSNNLISHYIDTKLSWGDSIISLGTAPFRYDSPGVRTYYLKKDVNYYSFDGNYFYTNIMTMLDDYRSGNYNNSINKDTPYFNYFMYLPTRSKTAYTEETFDGKIRQKGFTALPTNPESYVGTYVNDKKKTIAYWIEGKDRTGLSQMYGMGHAFINSQNTYGINALQTFASALTESASGQSHIAFYKNNLFGMGAADDNPVLKAIKYETIEASIMDYALALGKPDGYLNPNSYKFAGGHQGNKGSGINRWYASNPYSGEQHARDDYGIDGDYGRLDNYYNTLGIKLGNAIVPVYKNPSTSSSIIYHTKNYKLNAPIPNIPYIVTDKVYDEHGNGFYKIHTDYGLDENQNILNSAYYTFENSYGYIEESNLYVQNNQPEITASNIQIKLDDTASEVTSTIISNAVAIDYEDGNLTSDIGYDDSQVDYNNKGIYPLIYTVKDKSNFNVTKEVTLEVLDPEAPIIKFTEVSIPQYTSFDPNTGVEVIDANMDELSDITYTGTVDTNKVGEYTLTYSVTNKFGLTTTADRIIKVIANESPIINATNKTITQFDSIDLLSGVTATDKEDGDLTSSITYEGIVNTNEVGDYSVTYKVKDSVDQETTLTVTITVEEKEYLKKDGALHLQTLKFNDKTNLLDFSGFLKVNGITITDKTDIKYDLVLENQYDNSIQIIGLNRWLTKVPFTTNNNGYAWFEKSINLEDIKAGDYTVYVRARTGNYENKQLLKNTYFKEDISNKITLNGRGYHFRSDNNSRDIPLELFVRNDGLISSKSQSILYNMYNQFYDMSFKGSIFNLRGVSHSIGGNYGSKQNVTRELIIENIKTLERVKRINVGTTSNSAYNVVLKVPDGYSKAKAWYETSFDISDLEKGRYAIYLRTITGTIDDYGELYDILFKDLNTTSTYEKDGLTYKAKIERNNNKRFRLELVIE